jgi:hypothetical protein
VVSDRPAVDHDQTDQHLPVARPAVAAIAVGAELGWPAALEIRRREVVEHEIDLEREQVAQA